MRRGIRRDECGTDFVWFLPSSDFGAISAFFAIGFLPPRWGLENYFLDRLPKALPWLFSVSLAGF
jgi:hypothetical protein